MINKKELLILMDEKNYKPQTLEELIKELELKNTKKADLKQLLAELESEGLVIKTRYGRYGLPHRMNLVLGKLQGNKSGYAFLLSDREEEDVFISSEKLNGAMHGDKVIARLYWPVEGKKKREGEVIRIIKRARTSIVGRMEIIKRNHGFIIPDSKRLGRDFYVAKSDFNGAKNGDKVVADITSWPMKRRAPEAKVTKILGKEGDKGVDTLSVIHQYDLPLEFPESVLAEAKKVAKEPNKQEIAKRKDLRDVQTITIDGADARDLDDAITLEKLTNGNYKLGVHIADVGHYVKRGTKLDIEALKRGTSVYFPDRVLPMLPTELSNGICSLHPEVDRLTLSAIMQVTNEGKVKDYEIVESIIHSNARLTYTEVNEILVNENKETINKYQELVPLLKIAGELAKILRSKRINRGSIDFDFPEAKIKVDENSGRPVEIKPRSRTFADSIIEEFMLLANETVASHYYWLQTPFVYRVHDEPDLEKMLELNRFLNNFGIYVKGVQSGQFHPKAVQQVLDEANGKKEEQLINTVVLRSMQRAEYKPECDGHFGLAAKFYSHFTSPIRRYPDLTIHRIIKQLIKSKGKLTENERLELEEFVDHASYQSTERERIADEAERDIDDLLKVEYMAGNIGNEYTGVISGVVTAGFFVELPNTIEGFVHVSSLVDDYYLLEREKFRFIGQRGGRIFRLGDKVQVVVNSVSIENRRIEFTLTESPLRTKKHEK
ncbi:ribonuclease R [Clostridium sp. 'deep sea']|uniref:ribonuclease R n=1 Tax=Clostridium sp. 'deep sea' TaxID=2779445 RepID=UPI00189693A5|nr:ribonuclease R [Clostridium sp. 'deep sea']QOR34474.1 ribonuclease R [Clostridium sp. 'deep sea']